MDRAKEITKTSIVGIGANVGLTALKAAFGFIAGSMALVMDALNNLTDALSSVVTLIGVKLAKRKPNKKHPYGYGRIEYFSAMIVAAIVLAAGVTALVEAIQNIISPSLPNYTIYTFVVIGVSIVTKILLGLFFGKRGKLYNSDALVASGKDATFDAVISGSTLIGGIVAIVFKYSVEGIVGALISLFIMKAGFEMLFESIGHVIGNRVDSEISLDIKRTICEVEGVNGAYDLILHNYGPDNAIGSVHVEVSSDLTAAELHELTRKIQASVYAEYKVFLTVGFYALNERYAEQNLRIRELATAHEGVLGTHGFFVDEEGMHCNLDVVIDFTVRDKATLAEALKKEIAEVMPGYEVSLNFDANYSD